MGVVASIAALCAAALLFLVAGERRSDVPRSRVGFNPFNIVFMTSLLTERGRRYRVWLVLMTLCSAGLVIALVAVGDKSANAPRNSYLNWTEVDVRAELGKPYREFAGHYGLAPIHFKEQFEGEVKTLVFKKSGGEHYVSFEKRPDGSICICSDWLPDGGVF